MKNLRHLGIACLLLAGLGLGTACGGGGSGSGDPVDCADPSFLNLTGTWFAQEITSSEQCPATGRNFSLTISQTGSQLVFFGTTSWTATMCGSRATNDQSVTIPIDNGLRTYPAGALVLTWSSATAFSGTARWTFTQGSGQQSCSGTSTFSGTR